MGRALILLGLFAGALAACGGGTTGQVLGQQASAGAGGSGEASAGAAGDLNDSAAGAGGEAGSVLASGAGGEGGTPEAEGARCPTRFESNCSPDVFVEDKTADGSGQLYLDALGDITTSVQCITRDVCDILFRKTTEIRNVTRINLIVEDFAGVSQTFAVSNEESTIRISSAYLKGAADAHRKLRDELGGLLYYHATNIYQSDDGDGATMAWLVQGVAIYARYVAGYQDIGARKAGGEYDDGGYTTGFFLVWLDSQYPDFVYELNQSMSPTDPVAWSPMMFQDITGQSVEQLWERYQATL